jgi:diguanylate cyclase (GGDEF)-like protein
VCTATGPMHPRRAVDLAKQICGALVEAHAAELVHRDLKPSNLFLVRDSLGQEHVKILDFGVVKDVSDMASGSDGRVGSPHYMSPEQIEDVDVDGRSDLYSLGVLLYQFLCGAVPFGGDDYSRVLNQHLAESPPPFGQTAPLLDIPESLEHVTMRALSKSASDRFISARSMRRSLVELEGDLPPLDTPDWQPSRENPSDDAVPLPAPTTVLPAKTIQLNTGSIAEIKSIGLDGFVAYIDFNCPYCFALHERVRRWALLDKVQWCMIEHSSHILDGPFDLDHEQQLSTEVVEVHHRAPDVQLVLPNHRCRSTTATRLQAYVQRELQDKAHELRTMLFRALWQRGDDIGEPSVLKALLVDTDIPPMFLEFCDEEPPELTEWQRAWASGPYDFSIPVITHPNTGRVLIGLPDERTLKEFFLGEKSRILDSAACYYQQRPTVLVAGWMSHIWTILSDIRGSCEILQAPTAERAHAFLSEIATPDLLIVEAQHISIEAMTALSQLARKRHVPWLVATKTPSSEEEMRVLSLGAVEYLHATGETQVARARLGRILRDRYDLERREQQIHTDTLTGLPTRLTLLERLETEWERGATSGAPISLVLLDLDRFKPYNKAHGYLSGNEVLQQLAKRLQTAVRQAGSVVARFSGNEFAVLLPGVDTADAQAMAERLCQVVAEARIEHRTGGGYLTASVGYATLRPGEDASLHALVDDATATLKHSRVHARPRA